MRNLEVQVGKVKTTTNKKGHYTLPALPIGKHKMIIKRDGKVLRELEIEVKNGNLKFNVVFQSTGVGFIAGAQKMGEQMSSRHQTNTNSAPIQTQETENNGIVTYKDLPKGTKVGTGQGKMSILTDTGNVVSCNKADAYETEGANFPEGWESDTWRFPLNWSDCSQSIALGILYASEIGFFFPEYENSLNCYIESLQNVMHDESKGENAPYCNWEQKDGNHYNCSWFEGIEHTEALHTHK
ncbi:hypothetical protein V7152_10810 [Neobacillus drentensis]|uniref:hypothetical protein n=1 Tax=Neobacillus drentensis TaxID=220684 RepID=UPI002FFF1FC1